MLTYDEKNLAYLDAEDISELKLDSKITEDVFYKELVVHEKCESICSKWYLLQGEFKQEK